ncbi:MAG TPA: heliorhodopsin HeR [Candidatus Saccharimonadales bacterium]|nr:heliorhodopsin HeR [Candidatus Saccharimonadales bacterium]
MATTTRRSKAKTKTAKKTTAKTTVSKAVVSAGVDKKTVQTGLSSLNTLSIIMALALAGVAGFFMNHTSYQLFTGLLTKDELASKTTTVFVPAVHAVYDLELRWALVAILILSAIVPLLYLTRLKRQYADTLKSKVNLMRWIDMAVISALMVEVIALVSGVQDIATLKLIGVFIGVTCVLGWLSDRQNATGTKPVWTTYVVSLVTGALPWLLIATYAGGTLLWGMVRSPWWVYALYGTTVVSFIGYIMNQMRHIKRRQAYEVTERNALQISLFAKIAFAVILIVGLYKK